MLSVLWESLGTEAFSYSKVVKCSGSRWKAVSKVLNVKIMTLLIISNIMKTDAAPSLVRRPQPQPWFVLLRINNKAGTEQGVELAVPDGGHHPARIVSRH